MRNHRVGRRQNIPTGTVVLFQVDSACPGEILFKFFDIAHGGAAESIDGLVGISNYRKLRGSDWLAL